MKNTNGLFLVITHSSLKIQHLNTNIRYVCHTRITWERQLNRNEITQCRRCQQWGHATSNCFSTLTCVKCAEEHWSRECLLVKKDDPNTSVYIKCANCKGKHLAFSTECPVYQSKIGSISNQQNNSNKNTKRLQPNIKFVPAPIPENVWQRKRFERATETPSNSAQPKNNSGVPVIRQINSSDNNNFDELVSEFKELNSLIDVNNMLALVRSLNSTLKACTNEKQKFFAFNNFCQLNFGSDSTSSPQCLP